MMLTREYKETTTKQNKSKQNQTKLANDVQDMGCQLVINRNDSLKETFYKLVSDWTKIRLQQNKNTLYMMYDANFFFP